MEVSVKIHLEIFKMHPCLMFGGAIGLIEYFLPK